VADAAYDDFPRCDLIENYIRIRRNGEAPKVGAARRQAHLRKSAEEADDLADAFLNVAGSLRGMIFDVSQDFVDLGMKV
jgi:hypothetical protein